jgi:hypothetical protein
MNEDKTKLNLVSDRLIVLDITFSTHLLNAITNICVLAVVLLFETQLTLSPNSNSNKRVKDNKDGISLWNRIE